MKYLLLAAGLLLASGARAQTTSPAPAIQSTHYQYFLFYKDSFGWKLDYGQNAKPAVVDADVREDGAIIVRLNSEVAALNYLDSRGWEYVSSTNYAGRTSYLLRRHLT